MRRYINTDGSSDAAHGREIIAIRKRERSMTNDEQKKNDELENEELQKAEMELSDDDLDEVTGGASFYGFSTMEHKR